MVKTINSMNYFETTEFLKEIGHSIEELNEMWTFLVGRHPLITQLAKCGKTWKDLNTSCLKTLPREYKKMITNGDK